MNVTKSLQTIAMAAVISAGLAACGDQSAKTDLRQAAGREWPVAGGDWGNTRFSSLTAISTQNRRPTRWCLVL